MPTNRLLFQHGDTLALPSGPGETHLYKVERRRRDGYVLSSMAGAPDSCHRSCNSPQKWALKIP